MESFESYLAKLLLNSFAMPYAEDKLGLYSLFFVEYIEEYRESSKLSFYS